MEYIELDNKTALHKVSGSFPFKWDLNIYRGCNHGCRYCYALYSHSYLDNDDYFGSIYFKKNIISCLEKEISSPKWKGEVINLGGVCDSYQKAEEDLKIMPEILKLMIKYKNPIIISTKSNLILRDIELIDELSKVAPVNIAFTITTVDESIRKELEPNASPSIERFKALYQLKKTNAVLGVHIMPIIPYVTDNSKNLEKIYELSNRVGVDYVLPGMLYLRGKTRPYFLKFLKDLNVSVYDRLNKLYYNKDLKKEYRTNLYKRIDEYKRKYNLSSNYMKAISEKNKELSINN